MKKFFTLKNVILTFSILLNIYLGLILGVGALNEPTHKNGILKQDVKVGLFGQSGVIFELPKGITVEDVAPRGIEAIGQFENERFSIVVTSDRGDLVNYDPDPSELMPHGNYYSADHPVMEERK